jgi:VWFA-related protein
VVPKRNNRTATRVALLLCLVAALGWGQTQSSQPQTSQKQDIPDAPSAVRPPQPFGNPPPAASQPAPPAGPAPRADEPPPPAYPPGEEPSPSEAPPPPPKITTVPQGGATPANDSGDQLYKIVVNTNQVLVPVRVTDDSGHMVDGLVAKDFAVYEDGRKQNMNFFTSDPFALSAAVIVDLGMPDSAVQKVNQTYSALEGSFSQFDEVAVYSYSSTVGKMLDFEGVGKNLTRVLERLKLATGRDNGPAIVDGPTAPVGPIINGEPMDPNVSHVRTAPKESHVLNDAILQAAMDLRKRAKTRRKVIFVISDGQEHGSTASYSDVLKVLLTNGIAVYGVGVGGAAIPGYGKLQKIHLPRLGYGDILPRYANATAGEFSPEMSRIDIENIYSRIVGDARNQYTLGYLTRGTASESYRQIEVRVERPNLKVYARDGYYPAPPSR